MSINCFLLLSNPPRSHEDVSRRDQIGTDPNGRNATNQRTTETDDRLRPRLQRGIQLKYMVTKGLVHKFIRLRDF